MGWMGGWSAPRSGRFTAGKDPVRLVQEAGWAPGTVWTGEENLAPTGIRSPDRPARSELLYRLSYPGLPVIMLGLIKMGGIMFSHTECHTREDVTGNACLV